jgi:hypothetical protein
VIGKQINHANDVGRRKQVGDPSHVDYSNWRVDHAGDRDDL